MKKMILFSLNCFILNLAYSQSPDKIKNKIHLDSSTYLYTFYINDKAIKIKTDKIYYWYKSGRIFTTMEGYGGKVLNGSFTKYYVTNNLSEEGQFLNGLKSGFWKKWYSNGMLKEKSCWNKGILSGLYKSFDSTGRPVKNGKYIKGKFSGVSYEYDQKNNLKIITYSKDKIQLDSTSNKPD